MNRQIVFPMVRQRTRRAGLPPTIKCHSFRVTGITSNYHSDGGSLEDAHAIAAHESSKTSLGVTALRPHRRQYHPGLDREDQVLTESERLLLRTANLPAPRTASPSDSDNGSTHRY